MTVPYFGIHLHGRTHLRSKGQIKFQKAGGNITGCRTESRLLRKATVCPQYFVRQALPSPEETLYTLKILAGEKFALLIFQLLEKMEAASSIK